MKLLISLLVVFLMVGFVASPAMACGDDCGGHDNGDGCDGCDGHGHEGDPADDQGDGNDGGHDGGCTGDSCPI
ncbi:MAG: hypothetical protein KKB51_11510 [Candidatus Riflebacteria bacterium]|nr:hypothetical protein [Candidatus Riflebacteria bacterium]